MTALFIMKFLKRLMKLDMLLLILIIIVSMYFIFKKPKTLGNMLGFNQKSKQKSKPAVRVLLVPSIPEDVAREKMKGKSVIAFMADFCGHCTELKPAFFEVAKSTPSIHWVDASDGESKLVEELGVEGFPSIFYFENGRKVGEYKGARDARSMKSGFESFLK